MNPTATLKSEGADLFVADFLFARVRLETDETRSVVLVDGVLGAAFFAGMAEFGLRAGNKTHKENFSTK